MEYRAPFSTLPDLLHYISTHILQFHNVDITSVDAKGFLGSPLLQIVVEQELDESTCAAEANLLIDAGANVNCKGEMGETPLHSVAADNRLRLAKILLEAGADVNVRDDYGFTACEIAERKGHFEMATLLRKCVQSNLH